MYTKVPREFKFTIVFVYSYKPALWFALGGILKSQCDAGYLGGVTISNGLYFLYGLSSPKYRRASVVCDYAPETSTKFQCDVEIEQYAFAFQILETLPYDVFVSKRVS